MKKMNVLFAGLLSISMLLAGCSSQLKLKSDKFNVEVNEKPSAKANTYFDDVDGEVVFDKVDTSKLGKSKATFEYKGKKYEVYLVVQDTTSPVLKMDKKNFSFEVGTDVEKINEVINEEIKLSDNYDKKFDKVKVFDKKIDKAQEVKKKISVEDSNGNKSNEIEITVKFTEKKKATASKNKNDNKQVANNQNANSNNVSSGNALTQKKPSNNGNTQSSNSNSSQSKPQDKPSNGGNTQPSKPVPHQHYVDLSNSGHNDLVTTNMWFDSLAEIDIWLDDNPCGLDGTWSSFGYSAVQCSCGKWNPYFFNISYFE
ncbi:hypothetical protein [Amedibacterium intestinale]|uniref:hypothetical protein n=1 Tax=Amedibacterium intestinale TaxID=2583452 RepID=UPI000E20A06B